MEKSNKTIQANPLVAEIYAILGDLDLIINRVHSLFRLAITQDRKNQSQIDIMQDDFEIILAELKKYKNGEIQDN